MPVFDRDPVLAAMTGRFADFIQTYGPLKPDGQEMRGPCPIHQGHGPNFTLNPESGLWKCHSRGCGKPGGDVFDFVMLADRLTFPEALERVAAFAGLSPDTPPVPRSKPRPPVEQVSRQPAPAAPEGPFLDVGIAGGLHQNLIDSPKVQKWLLEHRGLTLKTLIDFQVGLLPAPAKGGEWRICFPVFDRQGRLTNIRKHLFAYKPELTDERRAELNKTLPWEKGLRAELFPLSVIDSASGGTSVLVVAGEPDTLLACQMGFPAVTGTLGEGNWKAHWTEAMRGLIVTVLYDGDGPGREGAGKVTAALSGVAAEVKVAQYPAGINDLTEWVMEHGAAAEDIQAILDAAEAITAPPAVIETIPLPVAEWPTPDPLMFHGLAGEIVRRIEPHTEADPVALLVQILAAFGSAIGRTAHFKVEADQHFGNLFVVMVGRSSKARKGTSWGRIKALFAHAEPQWESSCIQTGLSSGEGLIWHVRDAVEKPVKNKTTGETELEIVDPGIEDKRLLILESEYASVLRVAARDGNTLSAILRDAWDRGRLQTMTKNNAAKATGAHISLIGHVTEEELRRELSSTESGNGFANRFLWVCTRRSKELPEGGDLQEAALMPLARRLSAAIEAGRRADLLVRDEAARTVWREVYHDLSEGGPGLSGAVTSRGEAQTMRLALLYALLDKSPCIRREHLMAALALWEYGAASALYVFGDSMGDPVADDILRALGSAPDGLSRNDIRELFQRHQSSGRIGQALALLLKHGRARVSQDQTGGRPTERWFAIGAGKKSQKETAP